MNLIDIVLSSISFLSLKEKKTLKKNLDSIDSLAVLSIEDISYCIGRLVKTSSWNAKVEISLAQRALRIMENQNINGLTYFQEKYPSLLREINDPPYMIFYRGNIDSLNKTCVSLVGTRNTCYESGKAAFDFAKSACENDFTVISGLAYGIDSYSHKGALASEKEKSTVAVLPCGVDSIVPYGNKRIAEQILYNNGCILSEYIPGCPAEKWRFVQRNRLIAALSSGLVVFQAPAASGSLITANFALDYNRDLFFHSSCFCEMAKKIDMQIRKNKSFKKNCSSCEQFVEEGAPVISNFNEYLFFRNSNSFYNKKNNSQLELIK